VQIQLAVAAIALAISAALGWVLVRIGLRPLRSVERTALAIADHGDVTSEVPGADQPTEIGHLAAALNTMLGRIRDAFTERDATENELRRSEERMRRFVADASHELRTPLAAVAAYAELFDRGARDHPEDLDRAMRGITAETARMTELVQELLLLARLDEGPSDGAVAVDLSEIVLDAVGAARAVDPSRPIHVDMTDVVSVQGDPTRLRQVVDNLLANVRTHTDAGTTATVVLTSDSHGATLTVSDDGPGMSATDAARIFERFFRADPSRSRSSGGTGLGLSIVRSIVESHGGDITVATEPGAGLAVTIHLPPHDAPPTPGREP
jgi:two-component system OmpR family sensor kinase